MALGPEGPAETRIGRFRSAVVSLFVGREVITGPPWLSRSDTVFDGSPRRLVLSLAALSALLLAARSLWQT
jgi:hypothetical protein